MVTIFVSEHEEDTRQSAAASQAKQGQWMNQHNVPQKIQILSQWVGEDGSFMLCMRVGALKHILAGKTSLTQGRYMWRHNQV